MSDDRLVPTTDEIMLMRQAAERLRQEFDGTFNAESIERFMVNSQELLQSTAKFSMWLPIYPGKRYEDWDLPDPSGQPIEGVRQIRDDVRRRVEALVATLELDAVASEQQS